jgi:hypothetical protein
VKRAGVGALVLVALLAASACGESRARRAARADLVDQLVEGGLPEQVADCVVEAFFDARNDDELKDFFARETLTDDEREEFARLGEICTPS